MSMVVCCPSGNISGQGVPDDAPPEKICHREGPPCNWYKWMRLRLFSQLRLMDSHFP